MKRYGKFMALMMASVLSVTAIPDSCMVRAGVLAEETVGGQEYVVLAKNDKGLERIETAYGEEIIKEPEELDGSRMAVVELTKTEAVKLERDRNILLVEEDILFEGCSFPGDGQEENWLKGVELEETEIEEVELEEIEWKEPEMEESESEESGLEKTEIEEPGFQETKSEESELEEIEIEEPESEESGLKETENFEEISTEEEYETGFTPEEEKEIEILLSTLEGEEEAVAPEDQWNIDAIHANEQEYFRGQEQVKVAVMDTGVTLSNDIEVAGRINLIDGEEDVFPLYEDVSGHGTAVASIIAAKENETGITGVNPNAELYSVKVLDDDNRASLSRIIEGIYWCIDNDIDIINMSFGTSVKSEILEQVIKEADEAGILMIAAAGNCGELLGESTVEYPAAFEEVVAVGATNPQGTVSEMSSVGTEIELLAPGEQIPATGCYGEIVQTDGTSMAAPHVTGAASVLWARDREKSADFIRELLKFSAITVGDENKTGSGIVDLQYALSVYDAFAAGYKEDSHENHGIVEENPAEPESYDEAQVEASWNYKRHEDAVQTYNKKSNAELKYIRRGAKLPDLLPYTKSKRQEDGEPKDKSMEAFHGHNNYIANYMYMMRLARICAKSGMDTALAKAKYPAAGSEGEQQIKQKMKLLNADFKAGTETVLAPEVNTKENQAKILVGMATHIVMDTYAHKAYIAGTDGTWNNPIPVPKDKQDVDTDKKIGIPRWECAKAATRDVLDIWYEKKEPSACEFIQKKHDENEFRLVEFSMRTKAADPETYQKYKAWFDNHSVKKKK